MIDLKRSLASRWSVQRSKESASFAHSSQAVGERLCVRRGLWRLVGFRVLTAADPPDLLAHDMCRHQARGPRVVPECRHQITDAELRAAIGPGSTGGAHHRGLGR